MGNFYYIKMEIEWLVDVGGKIKWWGVVVYLMNLIFGVSNFNVYWVNDKL